MSSFPRALALGLVLAAGGGCGGSSGSPPAAPIPTPTPSPGGDAGVDPIFDQARLHDARLFIDPADWRALQEDFWANTYYAARISLDGRVLDQVGVRSRGEGSRSGAKPGLKVDFNRYVAGQEFGVYKSLDIDNQLQDPSFLRERLSFMVFEAMGIPAPHNSFARFYVNDEYWGVYSLTEPVSKPFLKARLGEESGNLFDYEWAFAWDFSFRGDDPGAYVPVPFQPQTNEDHLDPRGLVSFIQAVSETPDDRFVQDMGSWLDLVQFLTYLAVENAIAETDGFLGRQGVNNFYLYEHGQGRRFTFIPWDKDTALATLSVPVYQGVEKNVLARRLLADPTQRQTYVAALRRAVTSFVNARWLGPRADEAYAQIRASALEDSRKPWTNQQFEEAVSGTRGVIAGREADVLAQIGGSQ